MRDIDAHLKLVDISRLSGEAGTSRRVFFDASYPSCVVSGEVEERRDECGRLLPAEWAQANAGRPIAAVSAAVAFHPWSADREAVLHRLEDVVCAEVAAVVRYPSVFEQTVVLITPVPFYIK